MSQQQPNPDLVTWDKPKIPPRVQGSDANPRLQPSARAPGARRGRPEAVPSPPLPLPPGGPVGSASGAGLPGLAWGRGRWGCRGPPQQAVWSSVTTLSCPPRPWTLPPLGARTLRPPHVTATPATRADARARPCALSRPRCPSEPAGQGAVPSSQGRLCRVVPAHTRPHEAATAAAAWTFTYFPAGPECDWSPFVGAQLSPSWVRGQPVSSSGPRGVSPSFLANVPSHG